ncbi:MAG: hypothetical protein GQ524_06325 [Anaerolineales bacterium]|jgi:hypothetical protein|nr:hypothetical protein [Anaerolineales bacterium]
MAKRRPLIALVLLISACAPAPSKTFEPSKTLDGRLAAPMEATPTTDVEEQSTPIPPEPAATMPQSQLLPSSELQSYCLPWLDENPSPSNSIRLENGIMKGDSAIDFSLKDVQGETHRLSDLLETKPVLLILGGYT